MIKLKHISFHFAEINFLIKNDLFNKHSNLHQLKLTISNQTSCLIQSKPARIRDAKILQLKYFNGNFGCKFIFQYAKSR